MFKKSLFVMGVRITTLVVKFALTLFIARFLGLADLGWFGLVSSAAIAAAPLLGMGTMQVLARTAVRAEKGDLIAPLVHYLVYVVCLYLVILGVLLALSLANPLLVFLVWCVVLMEHLGTESYQLLVSRAMPIWANLLHFIRAGLWALLYIPLAYAFPALRNIDALLFFWFIGATIAFFGVIVALRDWPWLKTGVRLREGITSTFRTTRAARPLYISSVCETLSVQSDRFIITALLGVEATGIYVFFLQIGSALANLHYSGVVQMSRPAFVRTAAENPARLSHLFWSTTRMATLSTVLFSVAALVGITYLLPLIGKEALSAWQVIFYFVLVNFNLNVFAELQKMAMYSLHADQAIMRLTIINFVIALPVLTLVISVFGLIGAGISLVCIATIRVLMQLAWLKAYKATPSKDL
ncbi:lipopolysaccharide biosynthesis protein [Celeribacter baekdonensis]|uniref:lipopolysaccharide biosynthesis protein n=1 Tax=Celeribacter baekdonensis TaxID=875171 RepID=UPI00131EFFA0|nr:hypothetical protein [Celeribacter baekdonensis]